MQIDIPNAEDAHAELGPIHGAPVEDLSYLHYDKIETIGTSNEIPVLVLPTGKRIEFYLASSDVIHSFWVPEFLFKRDVNPNPIENNSDPVFQIREIEREGAFVGRCAEMCGTYHAMMNFEVRAVSPRTSHATSNFVSLSRTAGRVCPTPPSPRGHRPEPRSPRRPSRSTPIAPTVRIRRQRVTRLFAFHRQGQVLI